jgi:hypothetical protein
MSFTGPKHRTNWNYCSTCYTSRTEYPNGCKCESCGRKKPCRVAKPNHKKASEERKRIVDLLMAKGMGDAALLVEFSAPPKARA